MVVLGGRAASYERSTAVRLIFFVTQLYVQRAFYDLYQE